ncbi:protein RTE1-HOMOLOG-like [Hibiscus syriacus]|uniref:protein RTE1-HOMOLOG-like n=1 Tax=Hibiscus syriacus TaxID=106335 RepID=UPI0019228153|nr:protein RTE1-HOMOLOG-like [Hibiscus syriacus]
MDNEIQVDSDHQSMMIEGGMRIDPRRERFPCCIVWTSLPVISWLIPFVGHIGICREDGVILDFAGPNCVSVDDFAFGAVARYVQINKDKECCISSHSSAPQGDQEYQYDDLRRGALTWDEALEKGMLEFQQRTYSLFTCNCHSFVANNLNRLGFRSGGWNVVNIAVLIFLKGRWLSKAAAVRSYLPFVVVSGLGFAFGGTTYLSFLALFAFLLVGWFLLGTYCFKNLIYS